MKPNTGRLTKCWPGFRARAPSAALRPLLSCLARLHLKANPRVRFTGLLPLVVAETHDLLATPLSFGPSFLVSGLAYLLLRLSTLECLTSFADVRPTMSSADFWLPARPPEVSSAAFRAQSPNLRSACLMDMDFAVTRLLVPRSRLVSGFCSSTRAFAPRFLQTLLTVVALAFR